MNTPPSGPSENFCRDFHPDEPHLHVYQANSGLYMDKLSYAEHGAILSQRVVDAEAAEATDTEPSDR